MLRWLSPATAVTTALLLVAGGVAIGSPDGRGGAADALDSIGVSAQWQPASEPEATTNPQYARAASGRALLLRRDRVAQERRDHAARVSRAGGRTGGDREGDGKQHERSRAAAGKKGDRRTAADAKKGERRKAADAKKDDRRKGERGKSANRHSDAADKRAEPDPDRWVPPMTGYRLSARFGDSGYMWSSGTHTGLDFAAPEGTPIKSVAGGVVTTAGYSADAGWAGNLVVVELEDGSEIWHAHQSSVAVSVGETVAPGQTVGLVGSTGNSSGAHLHLEVQVGGEPVDPQAAMGERGVNP